MDAERQACPCCGHATLSGRAADEVCAVCGWQDDGQDDVDAHVDRGGANVGTLWQARGHYLELGACDARVRDRVRRPRGDEPKRRRWTLLDGVAVAEIPGSDVSPWNLLHDGAITGLVRRGARVSVTVTIPYLRPRFGDGDGFVLELLDCADLVYAPFGGDGVTALDAIAAAAPEILEARDDAGRIVVWGSAGTLRLGYRSLALRLDTGAPLALAALADGARRYWAAWSARE